MNERVDRLLETLAARPTDRSLEQLEAGVILGISRGRALAALARVRLGSIGLALAIGVAAGGMTAARFSAVTRATFGQELAPSSLLDLGR